jgi:hypothetical protein
MSGSAALNLVFHLLQLWVLLHDHLCVCAHGVIAAGQFHFCLGPHEMA